MTESWSFHPIKDVQFDPGVVLIDSTVCIWFESLPVPRALRHLITMHATGNWPDGKIELGFFNKERDLVASQANVCGRKFWVVSNLRERETNVFECQFGDYDNTPFYATIVRRVMS